MTFKNDKQRKKVMMQYNQNRTRQAVDSDLSKKATNTLLNTPENLKEWRENPRRIDIEGIDTPTIKGKTINNMKDNSRLEQKVQEKSTMTETTITEAKKIEDARILRDILKYKEIPGGDKRGTTEKLQAMSNDELVAHKIIRENDIKQSPSKSAARRIGKIEDEMKKRNMVV